MNLIGPISSIFSRFKFKITPNTGIWLFTLLDYPNVSIAFSNCTLPQSYEFSGKSTWNGFEILWVLCDWNTSFGLITPPYPDFDQIIGFLTGPTRIPGPCSGGGGSGNNIYNTSDSLTANRNVNQNNHNLVFNIVTTEDFRVEEATNNLELLNLKETESLLQNKHSVRLRSDDGTVFVNAQDVEINVLGGTLKATGLTQATKPMQLFYDLFTNEITYDFATVNNIYVNDGVLSGNRLLDMDDKTLTFVPSNPNSRFLVAKSGATFPPVAGTEIAALFVEPYDFVGSGKPASGMGYIVDVPDNDSASFLASAVSGSKAAMMLSVNNSGPTNNIITVNNNGINLMANIATDICNIELVPSTGVKIDGGSSTTVRIDNIPYNPVEPNVLHIDPGTKAVSYGEVPNIYNTSGVLTGTRVLNLNGSDLIINGTGNLDFSINNGLDGDVYLGVTAKDTILYGNVQMPDIANSVTSNILMYNTVNDRITYSPLTSISYSLFAVCLSTATFNVAGPYSTIQFPTTLGYTYATTNASGYVGYNSAGALLNTSTGVFSPSVSTSYNISAKVTIKNDTEIPNIILEFYDATSALVRSRAVFISGEINEYNTYILNENVAMTAARNYAFRMIINNGAGTTTSFEDCVFSINRI